MKRISVAISLALCMALPASAQMYKWVDSNGKVQYSDKPPSSNVKAETLREAPRAPAPPPASDSKGGAGKEAAKEAPKTTAEREQAFRKRQAEAAKAQEKEAQEAANARSREEYCQRAKANLANIEIGGRQTRVDAKGERVYLTDEEIAQETAKARQDVAKACK
jgi:hypothetical protein